MPSSSYRCQTMTVKARFDCNVCYKEKIAQRILRVTVLILCIHLVKGSFVVLNTESHHRLQPTRQVIQYKKCRLMVTEKNSARMQNEKPSSGVKRRKGLHEKKSTMKSIGRKRASKKEMRDLLLGKNLKLVYVHCIKSWI